jgi:hypothetical protein
MSCENGLEQISAFLDRELPDAERENVWKHIQACRKCAEEWESLQMTRRSLQALAAARVPASVAMRVRVTASHELQRRLVRASISSFLQHSFARVRLVADNMFQPVALPFTGGALSAMVLFGLIVPTLMSFPHGAPDSALSTNPDGTVVIMGSTGEYVPALTNGLPQIVRASSLSPDDANVVELTIDERGRVSNWFIARGQLTPDLTSIIIFSQFTPATVLGLPTSAKVKIVQRPPARGLRS